MLFPVSMMTITKSRKPPERPTGWSKRAINDAIPKPFELAIFLNIAEAAYDGVINQDPTASERYLDGLFQVLLPPNIMESNRLSGTISSARVTRISSPEPILFLII